ncbi:NALCN [Lepeophtheirus salmonis]|uniref:NALCN n=1 Tax=Lepeophtheirus salmonis TaxID=72036 RepID=A0A7R8D6M2_LEPSM|nr:NALCN [Lepeophtheirus salmonis]CAF3046423.1 NALCN [Lepeophtheirus salmonis]
MLARKQSCSGDPTTIADYGADDAINEGSEILWTNTSFARQIFRTLSLVSLVSVSLNTPKTFYNYPFLFYVTYTADLICVLVFTIEMSYFNHLKCFSLVPRYSPLSMLRAARPLIMIRFIRVFLKFSMPKARVNQIFKRSSHQIYNVTIFFLFFMSLYGLLGVQFFGEINNHCVRNTVTQAEDVTLNDLTIPDSYCNPHDGSGHKCPKGFHCMKLSPLGKVKTGFTGFGEFATSVFTVYQAASQEGWVYIMYRASDAAQNWKAAFYFTTMIFFLAWMVKNVFIAVITETFNEIRVQFQETWSDRERIASSSQDPRRQQVLEGDQKAWKLVTVQENSHEGYAPEIFSKVLRSPAYHIFVMLITLANAIVTASISFQHTRDQRPREYFFSNQKILEFGFTLFYDLEVIFKVFCLSFKGYIQRTIHKFELLLAVFTTIHILPIRGLFLSWISIFQVLRVIRLIKASPMLEDFVYKIFGPGRKLGSLIIFTMCLLVITSSMSMQLFCFLPNLDKFETFPFAFMSMFQILTQEAWPEVMSKTMERVNPSLTFVVAIYFILYHLFVTLIVMSLFVAVILDNLELDEESKKVKQLKVREESSDIKEDLPLRLKVFEKFPERPLMTRLHRIPSDFATPKVRDSFVSKFVYEADEAQDDADEENSVAQNNNNDTISHPGGSDGTHLRYRKIGNTGLISSPTRKIQKSSSIKKSSISNILWSVRRSIRGGSQLFHKRGGTYRLNENVKENGFVPGLNSVVNTSARPQNMDIKLLHAKKQQAEMRRNQKEEDLRENHPYFDRPLFAVPRESTFRKVCQAIVNARYDGKLKEAIGGKSRQVKFKTFHSLLGLVTYLDWTMIFITTLTTISMMFERPNYRVMDTKILQIMDYVFVIAMGGELTLKVLAEGMIFTPKALIKDVSGILDLSIFFVSLVWVCWMPEKIPANSSAQLLMLLRCFRPLRIFILVPHMRKVVCELCRGFKEIVLVGVLLIVLIFVFANYGVHLFGMKFAACNDSYIKERSKCVGIFRADVYVTKMNIPPKDCPPPGLVVPRVWMNPRRFNFDNIGTSMLALFEVLSFKGWPLHVPPKPENSKFQAFIYDIIQHLYFKRFIAILVLTNSFLLCVKWKEEDDAPDRINLDSNGTVIYEEDDTNKTTLRDRLSTASSALTICFVIEVFMKMIAFTPYGYWQSRRNRGDLFVTVFGVVWIIMNYAMENNLTLTFGYVVIILRFFTITGKHATLKMLMQTVFVSMYKIILFGSVKYGEAINRQANFRTAMNGISMLFRIVTGEDWNRVLHDSMLEPPYCTLKPDSNYWDNDCGNFVAAIAFFCSFYVIITYIVLNLLVAIIMENFSLFYSNEEDALLSYADIRNFQNTWNIVDVNQRGMIPVRRVKFILRLLKGRLEVDPQKDRLLFKHMCYELERLHNGDDVTFHDVLSMLSYRSVDIRKALQLEELLAREELEYIIEEEVAKLTIRKWLDGCFKKMREREQSLIAGLRAMNEPLLQTLRPLEEEEPLGQVMEEDEDKDSQQNSSPKKEPISSHPILGSNIEDTPSGPVRKYKFSSSFSSSDEDSVRKTAVRRTESTSGVPSSTFTNLNNSTVKLHPSNDNLKMSSEQDTENPVLWELADKKKK